MNEMRNELLLILQTAKEENKQDKKLRLGWLLERFECDIERQLEDLKSKEKELTSNLETLNYVRKELNIEK